jgi:hypothetical protein
MESSMRIINEFGVGVFLNSFLSPDGDREILKHGVSSGGCCSDVGHV